MSTTPTTAKRPSIGELPTSPSKKPKINQSAPWLFGQSPPPSPTSASPSRKTMDPLYNEPIFRSNRPAYLHPFAVACQAGEPIGERLVQAANMVLDNLESSYPILKGDLQEMLADGYLESEWVWLERTTSQDERACTLYESLWDTGFFDQVVRMDPPEDVETAEARSRMDSQRRVYSHAYPAIVKALEGTEGTNSLWADMDEDNFRAVLEAMNLGGEAIIDDAVGDLQTLRSTSQEFQDGLRRKLSLKWKRRGWEKGVWMGSSWAKGASLQALKTIAQIIDVHFVGHGIEWIYKDSIQGCLHYLRLVLGGSRFSLEEWAPILRLLQNRNIQVVRGTLFAIGQCSLLGAVRRRWSDMVEAAKYHVVDRESFSPLILPMVTMSEQRTARFMADLGKMQSLPRPLQVRMIGHHFGSSYSEEIDWAYFSDLLVSSGARQGVVRAELQSRILKAKEDWVLYKTNMMEYFHHFALDDTKLKLMSLRTAYAVRSEDFTWSGPVRSPRNGDC